MEYVCTDAKFLFWDGKKQYTVQYCYGISRWYVFNNTEDTGAIHSKEDKKIKYSLINHLNAENILNEYLQSIN